jgi:hypothetical protein
MGKRLSKERKAWREEALRSVEVLDDLGCGAAVSLILQFTIEIIKEHPLPKDATLAERTQHQSENFARLIAKIHEAMLTVSDPLNLQLLAIWAARLTDQNQARGHKA